MLDLSKITDIGLNSRDNSVEAMTRISDVIRSLSDVIVNQNENYIQSYISLQTFDNSGNESTSLLRRQNASSVIQQQYRDISLDNVIKECTGVRFTVPNSLITCSFNGDTYDFGFNGEKLVATHSEGKGDLLYYIRNGLIMAKPNLLIYNLSNQYQLGLFSVGTRYTEFDLFPDGSIHQKDRYVWLWINQNIYQDGSRWFIPVNAIIKDISPTSGLAVRAVMYDAPRIYLDSPDYPTGLLQTLLNLPAIAKMVCYLEPNAAQNFTYAQHSDTDYIVGNSLYIEWNQSEKTLIPLPRREDFVLNSELGRRALKFRNLPGEIVDWIRSNS